MLISVEAQNNKDVHVPGNVIASNIDASLTFGYFVAWVELVTVVIVAP